MIDGIKIMTEISTDHVQKIRLHTLDFIVWTGTHDDTTGEVTGNVTSEYRGLRLVIRKSAVTLGCSIFTIKGSLANFATTATDSEKVINILSMIGLEKAVRDLCSLFLIDAKKTNIQNLEISLTPLLGITAAQFIDSIVTQPRKYNTKIVAKGKAFKGVNYERATYIFKAYDKGLDVFNEPSSLLRIEVKKVDCRELRDKNGIYTLHDLTQRHKVEPLIEYLLYQLDSTIMIDEPQYNHIMNDTDHPHKDWINAEYWERLKGMQRNRERKKLESYLIEEGANTYKNDVLFLIPKLWQYLLNATGFYVTNTTELYEVLQVQNVTNTTVRLEFVFVTSNLNIGGKNKMSKTDKPTLTATLTKGRDKAYFLRLCKVCQKEINTMKTGAQLCSKKCSNVLTNNSRAQRRAQQKASEAEILERLKSGEVFKVLKLEKGRSEATKKRMSLKTLTAWTWKNIKQVHDAKLRLLDSGEVVVLTTTNAKAAIKIYLENAKLTATKQY